MSVFKDKSKTKDGRQWRFKVYYHNTDGKLVPYTSKRYLKEKEAKAEERVFILNRDTPVKKKFETVADDYFKDAKTRIRESTWISYKSQYEFNILPYFKGKFIDEINVADIEKWKTELTRRKIKLSSCNQYYVVLKEIFVFANKKYELNYNPVTLAGRFKRRNDEVRTKEKIRYISYEDFNTFIDVIEEPLWHSLFMTLYFTGMRKGELMALTWKDIDFNRNVISINKTVSFLTESGEYKITTTKNSLNREISMSRSLTKELNDYKIYVKQFEGFNSNWFVFGNNDVLKPHNITTKKDNYFKKANLEDKIISIHEFRHSHVSLCINEYLKSGQNDSTKFFLMMSQRMGHSLRVMQEVYMHLFPTAQDNIVDLLNNL